jgi:hypothetical protein
MQSPALYLMAVRFDTLLVVMRANSRSFGDAPVARICGGSLLWSLTFDDVDYRVRYGIPEICNAGSQRGLIARVEWR